ncbi:MAG TPA: hypothetical protein VF620_01755 [Allosphingosinicella sp.]|jgi:hypothetical protein
MLKFSFAAFVALAAPPAQAQAPAVPIVSNTDTAQELQTIRRLSACLAESRPRWARRTLARGYLSDAQARDASQALTGTDTCIRAPEAEVTFRNSALVAGLAEHFLRSDLQGVDFERVEKALLTAEPLNGSEDFALCVAARDPNSARELAFSDPGSAAESKAAAQLSRQVPPCVRPGENLTVDQQSLRALMSTALYRATGAARVARN